jgi:hypothetical protein
MDNKTPEEILDEFAFGVAAPLQDNTGIRVAALKAMRAYAKQFIQDPPVLNVSEPKLNLNVTMKDGSVKLLTIELGKLSCVKLYHQTRPHGILSPAYNVRELFDLLYNNRIKTIDAITLEVHETKTFTP